MHNGVVSQQQAGLLKGKCCGLLVFMLVYRLEMQISL